MHVPSSTFLWCCLIPCTMWFLRFGPRMKIQSATILWKDCRRWSGSWRRDSLRTQTYFRERNDRRKYVCVRRLKEGGLDLESRVHFPYNHESRNVFWEFTQLWPGREHWQFLLSFPTNHPLIRSVLDRWFIEHVVSQCVSQLNESQRSQVTCTLRHLTKTEDLFRTILRDKLFVSVCRCLMSTTL